MKRSKKTKLIALRLERQMHKDLKSIFKDGDLSRGIRRIIELFLNDLRHEPKKSNDLK